MRFWLDQKATIVLPEVANTFYEKKKEKKENI